MKGADGPLVHNYIIELSALLSITAVLKDLLAGRSDSAEDLLFEETGVADKSREGAEAEIAEVWKAICQLEEFRRELKRWRRLLGEADKPQDEQSTRSLNSIVSNRTFYIS